jgi:hypothetical protein
LRARQAALVIFHYQAARAINFRLPSANRRLQRATKIKKRKEQKTESTFFKKLFQFATTPRLTLKIFFPFP